MDLTFLMRIEYPLCLLLGLLVKLADMQISRKVSKSIPNLDYTLAILYGAVGGYLLSASPVFATVGLAIISSVLIAGKITHSVHQMGVAAVLIIAGLLGVHPVLLAPFMILLMAIGVDIHLARKEKEAKAIPTEPLRKLFTIGIVKDIAALFLTIAYSEPEYFVSMMLFDVGYITVKHFAKKK